MFRRFLIVSGHAFTAITLVTLSFNACLAASGNLSWSVRLYPENPAYVEVFINTKNAEKKTYYIDVVFDVSFFAQNKLVETRTFKFTGDHVENLEPGFVYRRFFNGSTKSINMVKGGTLNYTKIYGGLKPGPRDPILRPQDKHKESSGVSEEQVYEPDESIRTFKYLPLPAGMTKEIIDSYDRAITYLDKYDNHRALKEFQEIIAADPKIPVVFFYLGETFIQLNDCKKAREAYAEAMKLAAHDWLFVRYAQDRLRIYCREGLKN